MILTLGVGRVILECRKNRLQRNHIGYAMFVWARIKYLAYKAGKTIY